VKNFHQLITEISEYFIITAVLALPPLFVPHQTGAVLHVPSLGALLFYMAAALFLFLRARSTQKADAAFRRKAAVNRFFNEPQRYERNSNCGFDVAEPRRRRLGKFFDADG